MLAGETQRSSPWIVTQCCPLANSVNHTKLSWNGPSMHLRCSILCFTSPFHLKLDMECIFSSLGCALAAAAILVEKWRLLLMTKKDKCLPTLTINIICMVMMVWIPIPRCNQNKRVICEMRSQTISRRMELPLRVPPFEVQPSSQHNHLERSKNMPIPLSNQTTDNIMIAHRTVISRAHQFAVLAFIRSKICICMILKDHKLSTLNARLCLSENVDSDHSG